MARTFLAVIALCASAAAFAPAAKPAQQLRAATSLNAYVPPGFTAAEWAAKQRQEKQAKVDNKKKYPKGAPNVLGVGQYLIDLASDQTFKQEKVGEKARNTKINKTGHRFAKVKFGEFTKEAYDEWKAKGN